MVETEESFTYTEFRDAFAKKWNLWRKRKVDTPVIIGVYSDGTRFFWEDELGDRHYGLISNLSSFSIARLGQTLVTIPVNTFTGTASDTISPALNDSVLTNWRVIGSCRQTSIPAAAYVPSFSFTSTSVLFVRAMRPLTLAISNTTGVTVDGSDLVNVDVTVSNPHGSDAGVGPHAHTSIGGGSHPVTDPGHTHPLTNNLAQAVVTVDWMIVHK